MNTVLANIPTNIITGFLGAGKTSAILQLLTQKPEQEIWAVLVNEYGTMGIDAEILSGKGAVVEQVPGGCICCAQGLPFEVAINRLIKTARPDRLIIEPSGLAHPHRIIEQLSTGYFQTLLSLKSTICLVDPRHFSDHRYTTNEMFVDQIALADVLLANKTDLATDKDLQNFRERVASIQPEKAFIQNIQQGKFDIELLNHERNKLRKPEYPGSHKSNTSNHSVYSWNKVYPSDAIFDLDKLIIYFQSQKLDRLKAILKTNNGWYIFNQVQAQLTYYETKPGNESRIETLANKEAMSLDKCR